MFKKYNFYLLGIFLIILLLFNNFSVNAKSDIKNISLREALNIGKTNNIEIREAKKNYEDSKNEIKKIKANLKWNLSLNNSFAYINGPDYKKLSAQLNSDEEIEDKGCKGDMVLSLNKSYYSGLSLSSSLKIIETEPFDFANVEDNLSYNLSVSLPLYPDIPTETVENLIILENNLQKARDNLDEIIEQKEIHWIEDYLHILRLKDKMNFLKKKKEIFLDNLEKAEKKYELNEAGKNSLLNAKISLKEVEIKLKSLEQEFSHKKNLFYNNLGLKDNYEIIFIKENKFLQEMKEKSKVEILSEDLEKLYSKATKNNIKLDALKKELITTKNDYKILKRKKGIAIDANTAYSKDFNQTESENWEVSVAISWDMFDGGRQDAEIDNVKRKINYLEDKINTNRENIKSELNSLLDKKNLYIMEAENNQMKLEKARLEKENMEKKYKEDLVTKADYLDIEIKYNEKLNNIIETQDKILINNLLILNLIGEY